MPTRIKGFRVCWECKARVYGFTFGKELLNNLYWVKELSLQEIADIFEVTSPSIKYAMDYYKVKTRTLHESAIVRGKRRIQEEERKKYEERRPIKRLRRSNLRNWK